MRSCWSSAAGLFGFSVGNLITLPSLIVQREFDSGSFGVLVSLITAINQVTYAFGPGVIGLAARFLRKLRAAVLRLHRAGVDRGDADVGAGTVSEDACSHLVRRCDGSQRRSSQ